MAYRIKTKLNKDNNTDYYFMGYNNKGIPVLDAEYSSLQKRVWATKLSATRAMNKLKAYWCNTKEVELEEV